MSGAPCGIRGCKNGPAPFPDRRLNQAMSVISLSLVSFDVCVLCCYLGTIFRLCYFCVICVFCCLVLVMLSVPVQVIDWKDSSPKCNVNVDLYSG